ncbi:MAG: hypothetical protein IKH77_02975 [Clostridia bacterium]|nr:hypothetical protein [Clostridia bacterium]
MERDASRRERPEHDQIAGILREEEQFFRDCHHREPVGREHEDVVDNAWSRIMLRHGNSLSYTDVAGIYSEMRCDHAGY